MRGALARIAAFSRSSVASSSDRSFFTYRDVKKIHDAGLVSKCGCVRSAVCPRRSGHRATSSPRASICAHRGESRICGRDRMDAAHRSHDGVVATAQTSITRGNARSSATRSGRSCAERTTDLLSALERSKVGAAQIAQVAALIELASALDDVSRQRRRGLGSIVKVADRAGRTTEYELIERVGSGGRAPEGDARLTRRASAPRRQAGRLRPGHPVQRSSTASPCHRRRPRGPLGPSHAALEAGAAAA